MILYRTYCVACGRMKENYFFTPGQLKLNRSMCRACCSEKNALGTGGRKVPNGQAWRHFQINPEKS